MSDHVITWQFGGYAGLDVLRSLLPERMQARHVARCLLRGPYKGFIPGEHGRMVIEMPVTSWHVLDAQGTVSCQPPDGRLGRVPI